MWTRRASNEHAARSPIYVNANLVNANLADNQMSMFLRWRLLPLVFIVCVLRGSAAEWNAVAAAGYLDSRATWWESWPPSQRDHSTVCVSCHTMLPYALSRPRLGSTLHEKNMPDAERTMLRNVEKRVSLWGEVAPYYLDATSGPGKSKESRSTEAVLNTLILASNDRASNDRASNDKGRKQLAPITRTAFAAAWALQIKSGDRAGAWDWQIFHLSPWEASESQYQGATFMALAVGWAPAHYRRDPEIQANWQLLRSYLKRECGAQPLLNRIVLLWASARVPELLSKQERQELIGAILKEQQTDGGWSLASLGNWKRSDHTPQETASDGYATGLITLALEQTPTRRAQEACASGRSWLENHQNRADGSWRAYSLNKKRDLTTDVGRFMTDAATGYAVLALADKH